MNRILLLSLLLGASAAQAATLPACSGLTTIGQLLSSQSCTAGIFTVKNVTFSGPTGLENLINLNANVTEANVGLGFSSGFLTTGVEEQLSFTFGYTIDPPPDIIKGVSGATEDAGQDSGFSFSSLQPAALGPNAVEVNYLICAGAGFVDQQCAGTIYGFSLTLPDEFISQAALSIAAQLSGGVTFAQPTNTVGILVTVNLQNGGFLGSLSSNFPLETAAVPEPSTLALAGVGGLLLAAGRRRRLRG